MDMSATNNDSTYKQIREHLSSGHFKIDQSSNKPYITVNGEKKVVCITYGKIQIKANNLQNISNAQNAYRNYQSHHQCSNIRKTGIQSSASNLHLPPRPRCTTTAQTNTLMQDNSQQVSQRVPHKQSYRPKTPVDTELTKPQLEILNSYMMSGEAYFNDEAQALTQLNGFKYYIPNKNDGFKLSLAQNPLKGYHNIKKQYDNWLQKKHALESQQDKPSSNAKDTSHTSNRQQRAAAVPSHQLSYRTTTPPLPASLTISPQPSLPIRKSYNNYTFGSTELKNRSYLHGSAPTQKATRPTPTSLPATPGNTQVSDKVKESAKEPKATPAPIAKWGIPEPVNRKPLTTNSAFRPKHQPSGSDQMQSTRAGTNITPAQPNKAPAKTRQASGKPIEIDDVILPTPPTVKNADEAKRLLQKEFDNQSKSINDLNIEERYELKEKIPYSRDVKTLTGARKKQFTEDLKLQLRNANQKIDQSHTPKTINQTFRDQWLWMKRQGVYRHWCLRQAAPNNPLPHYPGRVSIQNTGQSCGPDASIIQLLHSGTMNYFIFRPQAEGTERNTRNDHKNNVDNQREWQRLYRNILFGSPTGGQIEVPDWVRDQFSGMWNYTQVNSYSGSFFDPEIVWTPKEPLKRLNTPDANTTPKLEERILGDWRTCRLHTSRSHYTALIKDKNGKITSIDMSKVDTRTFKNSQELLDLFLAGKFPYHDPSFIEFWE